MRKIYLASAIFLAGALSAQIDFSQIRYGVTGGYNYSGVKNAHNPSGRRSTFQLGALALIPVDKDNQFFIQPEVEYYGAGETGKAKDAKGKPGYDAVYANNYISVPVYFKGYFSEAASEFYGLLGPRFNFLVNQKVSGYPPNRPWYQIDGSPERPELNGKAAGFNFGIGAGIGYSWKRQLELALKYDLGLSNTYPHLAETFTGDPAASKKKSEQVISVTLSYIFK